MYDIEKNQNFKLTKLLYVSCGIIVTIPIVLSILKNGVDCDSAYYICIGERISEGYVPYINLCVGYTPLWFYIEALYKTIFNVPNGLYWPYLCLFYFFEVFTAYFLYKFIVELNTKRIIAYLGAGLFLLECHWLWGNCVLLEIPFMFWGLLSCWLIMKWRDKSNWYYLIIGIVSSFSFLSKQYGAGFFVLNIFAIIFLAKKNYHTIVYYVIGYVLPIVICIVLWGSVFIYSILLNGYGTSAAVAAGQNVSFEHKSRIIIDALVYAIKFLSPAIIVALFLFIFFYKQNRLYNILFAYCGVFGFLLQFYFSYSEHYFIPIVPFGVILITEIFSLKSNRLITALKSSIIVSVVVISMYKTYYNRVYKMYVKSNVRDAQLELAEEVKDKIGVDKTIFIIHGGIYYIYFLADVLPPNIKTIGYTFGPQGLNESDCAKQISAADYVLRFSNDYSYESFFTDSLKKVLENYPVIEQYRDSTILLHKCNK